MAIAPAQFYAAPFDAIAERYDERFTCSKIGRAQRASVWRELEEVSPLGIVFWNSDVEPGWTRASWRTMG